MATKRSAEELEETSKASTETLVAVAGSYEGGIYGWTSENLSSDNAEWKLATPQVEWAFGGHMGAIKSIAIDESGEILATGGVDEYIKIYNLKSRKEKGELSQHSGSITSLQFIKSSHLLSASSDGTLCIWSTKDWACLHIMGGHKGAITCISVHPSGRMALSGSVDHSIRLWNLVEGKCAYITKPKYSKNNIIELIEWSESGSSYAVVSNGLLNLYNATQEGKPCAFMTHAQIRRINAVKFIGDDLVAIAGDNCLVQILSCSTGDIIHTSEKGDARLKDLTLIKQESKLPLLLSVSSSGHFQFWEVPTDKSGSLRIVNFGCAPGATSRLTCCALTVRKVSNNTKSQQKKTTKVEEPEVDVDYEDIIESSVQLDELTTTKVDTKVKKNKKVKKMKKTKQSKD